ncbi:MAG: metallophosphoesterase [Sediminibacterium sp.]
MNRRKFLQQGSLSAAVLSIAPASFAAEKKAKSFKAAFLSDVHVKPTEAAEQGMRKAYRHVNALKPSVDFVINGGDAIMDALNASKDKVQKQWDVWNNILKDENRLPIRHCIGNHDAWGWQMTDPEVKNDPLYDKKWVMQQHKMSERFYSFEHKGWKFIVLDSPQENNGGYIARLDEPQFTWLENELKQTDANQHVCIVSHIPIVSFCAAVFYDKNEANGDWKISRALLHVDSRRITDMFRSYKNIRCCLSGHIHLQDHVEYRGIPYYCNGAVSGDWWNGPFKGFEPAYAVFEFGEKGTVRRTMIDY